jgi:hypothetical protein
MIKEACVAFKPAIFASLVLVGLSVPATVAAESMAVCGYMVTAGEKADYEFKRQSGITSYKLMTEMEQQWREKTGGFGYVCTLASNSYPPTQYYYLLVREKRDAAGATPPNVKRRQVMLYSGKTRDDALTALKKGVFGPYWEDSPNTGFYTIIEEGSYFNTAK